MPAGNVKHPADGSASATIDRLVMTWNNQPIRIDGPATIKYVNQEVRIDGLTAHALDSSVTLNGMLPLDARNLEGAVDLDAKLNLATLASYAPPSAELTAEGGLILTGTIRGSLRRIDPTLSLTVDNASVNAAALKQPILGIGVRLEVADGALQLSDLRAALGTGLLAATGTVPFSWLPETLPFEIPRGTGPAQVHATLSDLDLASLPGVPEKLKGGVSVRAEVEAPRPEVASVTGRLVFPDLQFDFDGLTLAQQDMSEVGFANGNIDISKFVLERHGGPRRGDRTRRLA